MLHGDFVRSPLRPREDQVGINKDSGDGTCPASLAVLTAADLKPLNLHYMPTLAGDVQAVLAEEKVLFQ